MKRLLLSILALVLLVSTGIAGTSHYTDPVDSTSVTTTTVTITGLTASKPVFTDASKVLTSSGTVAVDQGGTGQVTAAAAFGALKQNATDAATGVVELATDAETVIGSATDKVTTPANITARLAAPGAIGGTTPAAGTFTTLATTGDTTIGSTSAGKNLTVLATLGSEEAPALTAGNWTVGAGWESPIVGPGLIKNADGTGTATPTAATTIVAGNTYVVTITLSACSVGSASYSLGGVTGVNTLSAATTYTERILAKTTGKLIISPTNTSRLTISAISIKMYVDGTGDVSIDGNLTVNSPAIFNNPVYLNTIKEDSQPVLSFGGDTDTGMRYVTSNWFTFVANGIPYLGIDGANGYTMVGAKLAVGSAYNLFLENAGANILALRRSTNQQTYQVYNTYTDTSNYERAAISGVAGTSINITAETAGTGGDNLNIVLTPAGTGVVKTKSIEPITDDTYYLGKNDDDTPFAFKGLILKDTTNGKYYRIEVTNGSIVATDLTD